MRANILFPGEPCPVRGRVSDDITRPLTRHGSPDFFLNPAAYAARLAGEIYCWMFVPRHGSLNVSLAFRRP